MTKRFNILFTEAPDAFIQNFVTSYEQEKEFRDYLILFIMKVFVANQCGNSNKVFNVKAMHFLSPWILFLTGLSSFPPPVCLVLFYAQFGELMHRHVLFRSLSVLTPK